ncbi:hypothetical protein ABH926_007227 [Catenulispora sp. GP43]|uniref:hypothetical protein n=1 Tax=Catenulispora sp. GP43 TaxID=3156263 RepID=UPI0035156DE9
MTRKRNTEPGPAEAGSAIVVLVFNAVVAGLGGLYVATRSTPVVAVVGAVAVAVLAVVRRWDRT